MQCGIFRRKVRTSRRSSLPRENPLLFYPRRLWEATTTLLRAGLFYLKLQGIRHKIMADRTSKQYHDVSLTPVAEQVAIPEKESCGSCDHEHDHDHAGPAVIPLAAFKPAADLRIVPATPAVRAQSERAA